MIFKTGLALLAALGVSLTTPAPAATFNADFGGVLGTFEAPIGGGLISAFNVTLGGTTFDTLAVGNAAPVYNPVLNTLNGLMDVEFTGAGQSDGEVRNSMASASCGVGDCVLILFGTGGGNMGSLPEFLALNTITFDNLDLGLYSINPAPVPIPPALPLFLVGIAAMVGIRRWRLAG